MDVFEHVDIQSLSQVASSSSPSHEDRVDCIYSLLEHFITLILTNHNAVTSNLSTLLEQGLVSKGGACWVDTDDDTSSTNPGSQASLHNVNALSSLQKCWKTGHGK